MTEPFFSIIVPTFNRTHSLGKVIGSILAQTFTSWEVIIVDDGGDEAESLEVLSGFNDLRIRYFWKRNEERSIARNYGFGKSRGRYVIPLDSDDQILPNHLEKIFGSIQSFGELEFFHTSYVINDLQRKRSQIVGPYTINEVTTRIIYQNIFAIGAAAIRSDIACQFPFPESPSATHGEDWFFYLRVFSRYQVHWIDSHSFVYNVNSDSSIKNIDPDRFRRSYDIILTQLLGDETVRNFFGSFRFRTMIGYQTLGVALQYVFCEKPQAKMSFLYVMKGLKFAPWLITNRRFFVCLKKFVGL